MANAAVMLWHLPQRLANHIGMDGAARKCSGAFSLSKWLGLRRVTSQNSS
jgi:hypothetical protein